VLKMSLNWNIKNVLGFKKNPDDYYLPIKNKKGGKVWDIQPITKYLVFKSMAIGLDKITKQNIDEWLIRISLIDELYGTTLMMKDDKGIAKPYHITSNDLERHIGLWTNANTFTRKKLVSNCVSGILRDIHYKVYQDVEKERLEKERELSEKVVPISSKVKKAVNSEIIS